MKKIPCIKCDASLYEYIRPNLLKWGYTEYCIGDFNIYEVLYINFNDVFGSIGNSYMTSAVKHNRYIFKSSEVEEFLEYAAKLKGKTYIKKICIYDKLTSGMVVKLRNNEKYLIVNKLLVGLNNSFNLSEFNNDLTNKDSSNNDIVEVYNPPSEWIGGFKSNKIYHGQLIW